MDLRRQQGYLIIGSGMAVHSFSSIDEIRSAPDASRNDIRAKVLAESTSFDRSIRAALSVTDSKERNAAILRLEDLYEFKRSHPTVEVSTLHEKKLQANTVHSTSHPS